MNSLLRLVKLAIKNDKYRKLLVPIAFFAFEVAVALILNWQLFGERYEFSRRSGQSSVTVHNPLIVIRAVHSDRLTHPYGTLSSDVPLVKFYSRKYIMKAMCFLTSLVFAYIGIFISLLWLNRLFQNNKESIQWWLWPTACIGAHFVLYLMANSSLSNMFLRQM